MGKVIAVANEKGGVAKTTSTKNIAVGLAKAGKRVLAIDTDPSTNLTSNLGIEVNDEIGNICDIYMHYMHKDDGICKKGIYHQEEGIDVIPSTSKLYDVKELLNVAKMKEIMLRNFINTIRNDYDYILIDCPAGSDILPINALFAADSLIVPTQAHISSIEALNNLLERIKEVRLLNGTGNKPDITGVLFITVRAETNNDKYFMKTLREQYGETMHFFDTFIPQSSRFPESDYAKESIFKYASGKRQAMFYKDLVDEILEIEKGE